MSSKSLDDELQNLMKISENVDQSIEKYRTAYKHVDFGKLNGTFSNEINKNEFIEKALLIDKLTIDESLENESKLSEPIRSDDEKLHDETENFKNENGIKSINEKLTFNEKEEPCNEKEDIGPNATIRYQKAQMETMKTRLEAMAEDNRSLEKEIKKLKAEIKDERKCKHIAQRALDKANSNNESNAQLIKNSKSIIEELRIEIASLQKENSVNQKMLKAVDRDKNTRNLKLSRALEECEKHKQMLSKVTEETKKYGSTSNERVDELTRKVQMLERQRNDLILGFRKQMKLIELLKRQKVHLELAKLLNIHEADFLNVIDWNNSSQ